MSEGHSAVIAATQSALNLITVSIRRYMHVYNLQPCNYRLPTIVLRCMHVRKTVIYMVRVGLGLV